MRRVILLVVAAVALVVVGAFTPAKRAEASHWSYCVLLGPGTSPLPFLVETVNVPLLPNPKACVASNFGHTGLPPWPPGFCGFASIGIPLFQCTPPCGISGVVQVTVHGPPNTVGFATCTTATGYSVTAGCQVPIGGTTCTKTENWTPPGGSPPLGNLFQCGLAVPPPNIAIIYCQS